MIISMKKIITGILILLLLIIPALLLFFIYPGNAFREIDIKPEAVPPPSAGSNYKSLRVHEDWIRNRILAVVAPSEEQAGLVLRGLDVKSSRKGLHLLAAADIPAPLVKSFPLLVGMDLSLAMKEQLVVSLERLTIGRLPLPSFILERVAKRADAVLESDSRTDESPFSYNISELELYIDAHRIIDDLIPGARPIQVTSSEQYLDFAIALPKTVQDDIAAVARSLGSNRGSLLQNLNQALPEGKKELSNLARSALDEVESFTAEPDEARGAIVAWFEGEVEVKLSVDSDFTWLAYGDSVPEGSTVRTGKDSFAELLLPGGHIVRMDESSSLIISHALLLPEGNNTAITQLSGSVRNRVARFSASNSSYEVTVGTTVMGVRGTDFTTLLDSKGEMKVLVLTGSVSVKPEGEREVYLAGNEALDIKKGAPQAKREILPEEKEILSGTLNIRTTEEDIESLLEKNLTALLFPYVMEMAEKWEALDEREKEAVQSAVEKFLKEHPEVVRSVDNFLGNNDMEEQRAQFEQMFM
jgi:hypothetical protein